MTATRNGNTITVAPLVDSLAGLKSGWAIRFTEFPQYLFHTVRNQTADQAIAYALKLPGLRGCPSSLRGAVSKSSRPGFRPQCKNERILFQFLFQGEESCTSKQRHGSPMVII